MSQKASALIQARTSWRSCTGQAIAGDKLVLLEEFISKQTQGVFGDQLRFELVAARATDTDELKGLGTYGFIRGASAFVVGAVDREINNLEDYGLLMEDIVLFATQLDLATCWLGGTFHKDNFSTSIKVQAHEVVPAVVSVGIGADNRNVVDRLIRNVAGSKRRLSWELLFFEGDGRTPLQREKAGKLAPVFDMLRLSPSASNKQPWRLVLDHNTIHFYLQRTRGYRKPMFCDLQRIDMGIAMSHFQAVCREVGVKGAWRQAYPTTPHPGKWEYIISWDS